MDAEELKCREELGRELAAQAPARLLTDMRFCKMAGDDNFASKFADGLWHVLNVSSSLEMFVAAASNFAAQKGQAISGDDRAMFFGQAIELVPWLASQTDILSQDWRVFG